MVTSISRKRAAVMEGVVVRTAASLLGEMARSLDIGGNLGLVSVVSSRDSVVINFFSSLEYILYINW